MTPEEELWEAFHGHQTETLRAPRAAVEALCPRIIVVTPREGSKTVVVSRAGLWEFLRPKYRQGMRASK